jgi:hypothetical protein
VGSKGKVVDKNSKDLVPLSNIVNEGSTCSTCSSTYLSLFSIGSIVAIITWKNIEKKIEHVKVWFLNLFHLLMDWLV